MRPEVIAARGQTYAPLSKDTEVNLLVVGGSQGAKYFGEIVPRALVLLEEGLRSRLRVALQCRVAEIETEFSNKFHNSSTT